MTDADTLQALAYLYIAFGHATDETLTPEEMRTLATHLRAWLPEEDYETVGDALKAAMKSYLGQGSRREQITGALERAKVLAAVLPEDRLGKIHEDLRSIAAADGTVSAEETKMMDAIARVMASA